MALSITKIMGIKSVVYFYFLNFTTPSIFRTSKTLVVTQFSCIKLLYLISFESLKLGTVTTYKATNSRSSVKHFLSNSKDFIRQIDYNSNYCDNKKCHNLI